MLVVLLLWASGTPYAYSTGNGLASGGKPKKNKGRFRNEKKILYRSSSAGCAPRRIRGDLTGRGGHTEVERGRETCGEDHFPGILVRGIRRGRTAHGVLGGIGNRFQVERGRETCGGDHFPGILVRGIRRGRTVLRVLGGIGNRFHFKFGRGQPLAGERCGSVPVGGIYAIVEQRNRVRAGRSGVVTNVD